MLRSPFDARDKCYRDSSERCVSSVYIVAITIGGLLACFVVPDDKLGPLRCTCPAHNGLSARAPWFPMLKRLAHVGRQAHNQLSKVAAPEGVHSAVYECIGQISLLNSCLVERLMKFEKMLVILASSLDHQ